MKKIPRLSRDDVERFWNFVDRKGPAKCWNWVGYILQSGYGQFAIKYKKARAHRVAFLLGTGKQPGRKLVCHRCDNPLCCNPKHLFLGTSADNSADMAMKGRAVRQLGVKHGHAKLTESQVRFIRKSKLPAPDLASRFGVSFSLICMIRRGTIWRHLLPNNAA